MLAMAFNLNLDLPLAKQGGYSLIIFFFQIYKIILLVKGWGPKTNF